MLLVIDNYDSFTFNLVQYLGEEKVEMQIHRNDEITLEQIKALKPERILISPGPCTPREAGLSNEIIKTFGPRLPLLGVCLGHQCIAYSFGAEVVVNDVIMHGKTSPIKHDGRHLFEGIPNPFVATRYHSLAVKRETLPDCFDITAETQDGIVMAIEHRELPLFGLQFHPESIASEHGHQLLGNFLDTTTH